MNKFINACNFYLGLRCLYNLQGVLYASGGVVSRTLLLLFLLLSLYYIGLVILKYKLSRPFKCITIFFALLFIYGVFLLFTNEVLYATGNEVPRFEYLKSVMLSFGPVYACYYFTKQKTLTATSIKIWVYVYFLVATLSFFNVQQSVMELNDADAITNNMAYSFLALMPAVFLFDKKPAAQYLLLGYCLVFILMGVKRGAILIGTIALLYFVYFTFTQTTKKYKFYSVVFTLILLSCLLYFVNEMVSSNDYFMSRVESTLSGDTSGRDELYSGYLNHFLTEQNFVNFIFGHGANGSIRIFYDYAHNDWLELAINQGILGLFLYLLYWLGLYKYRAMSKHNNVIRAYFTLFIMVFFMKSLFSMSYNMSIYASSVLGYMIATVDEEQSLINRNK